MKYFKIIFRFCLIIFCFIGLFLSMFGKDMFMNANTLLYFTIQSNIWILVSFVWFLVLDILKEFFKKDLFKNWMYVVKYVFTISITLTFFVFAVLLVPLLEKEYLTSLGNLCVHFIVPIMSIVDFLVFDKDFKFTNKTFLFSSIPPLTYFFVTIILSYCGVKYGDGAIVPYFFMNYVELGWFSFYPFGVINWVLILAIFVLGVAYLLLVFRKLINKAKKSN